MPMINVVGDKESVEQLLRKFRLKPMNRFPSPPDKQDLNLTVTHNQQDEVMDWCYDNGIECEQV